jgi:hypothetical protein
LISGAAASVSPDPQDPAFAKKSLCLRLCEPMTRFAATLLDQADTADHHAPVHGLAHVVDRQQAQLHSGLSTPGTTLKNVLFALV